MAEHITVAGNVATEPIVAKTDTGTIYTRFRVACTHRFRDAESGQWRDGASNWYTVFAYGTLAENTIKSVSKGMRIVASGTLEVRDWERDERSGVNVNVKADALGIDLRWGKVTGYERTSAGRKAEQDAEAQGDEWLPAVPEAPDPPADADGEEGAPAALEEAALTPF